MNRIRLCECGHTKASHKPHCLCVTPKACACREYQPVPALRDPRTWRERAEAAEIKLGVKEREIQELKDALAAAERALRSCSDTEARSTADRNDEKGAKSL